MGESFSACGCSEPNKTSRTKLHPQTIDSKQHKRRPNKRSFSPSPKSSPNMVEPTNHEQYTPSNSSISNESNTIEIENMQSETNEINKSDRINLTPNGETETDAMYDSPSVTPTPTNLKIQMQKSVTLSDVCEVLSHTSEKQTEGDSKNEKAIATLGNSADDILESHTQRNYITALGTERLANFADDILDSLRLTQQNLVPLKAWLEKKQESIPYQWQRRWVVVSDGYLLWSDRQMSIQNGVTPQEKKRWNKCFPLKQVTNISAVESKKQRKFKTSMKGRDYIWRCVSKEVRDAWTNGMEEHKAACEHTSILGYDPF